ncbi:MAG: hypothetical protein AB1489_40335 [Acidobacteriota bacterium]
MAGRNSLPDIMSEVLGAEQPKPKIEDEQDKQVNKSTSLSRNKSTSKQVVQSTEPNTTKITFYLPAEIVDELEDIQRQMRKEAPVEHKGKINRSAIGEEILKRGLAGLKDENERRKCLKSIISR